MKTHIKSFHLENFKAVHDSGVVKLTPLTVLIGNNGSGKSSLIEGLETYRSIVVDGLDNAMRRWFGMKHVWNKRVRHTQIGFGLGHETHQNPIRFDIRGSLVDGPSFQTTMSLNADPGENGFFIQEEHVRLSEVAQWERLRGLVWNGAPRTRLDRMKGKHIDPGESGVSGPLLQTISKWQFLNLIPEPMGRPVVKTMAGKGVSTLNRDGSNLAQYLLMIREKDTTAFEGIVEMMHYVLNYARNFQPEEVREIQPTMYLKMLEQVGERMIEIPGWLISSGTLRVLSLLAVLRNPDPPPLLVVEEIENGLDPRSVNLILQEIHSAVESGRTQVIATTHSPYLLDLLDLSHVVLCERLGGEPIFMRPQGRKALRDWAKSFAPGQLYTMDRLHAENHA